MSNHFLKIFVDADAFISLIKSDDDNHSKALQVLNKLQKQSVQFWTSNYVFAEVVTVLSLRVNRRAATDFIEQIKSNEDGLHMIWVDEKIEHIALDIFKRQTSKNVSFMDCCHMACINHYRLDEIFSFDHIYRKNNISISSLF